MRGRPRWCHVVHLVSSVISFLLSPFCDIAVYPHRFSLWDVVARISCQKVGNKMVPFSDVFDSDATSGVLLPIVFFTHRIQTTLRCCRAVGFWRRLGGGLVVLTLTALVRGVLIHFILLWFDRVLMRDKGIEPAVFYFVSQATAECIKATPLCIGSVQHIARLWIRSAVEQSRGRSTSPPRDRYSTATGAEETDAGGAIACDFVHGP